MQEKIRVLIVHGHCLLRGGLEEQLQKQPDVEVCAVTSMLEEAPDLISQHRPDILLVNVSPKCSSGMIPLKKLKKEFPEVRILAFSCSSEFEDVYAGLVLESRADGYVSSIDTPKELISAIRTLHRGRQYMSPKAKQHRERVREFVPEFKALSLGEAEVFCLTDCGYITHRIAEMMSLKVKTVETYRERIRKKLYLAKGSDLLYASVSFMRSAARRGVDGPDDLRAIRELLSTTRQSDGWFLQLSSWPEKEPVLRPKTEAGRCQARFL